MTTADEQLRQYRQNNPELADLNPELFGKHPALKADPVVKHGQPVQRQHKYNAQATEINGIRFDSKREAQRYRELQFLVSTGEIHALQLQPRFELQPSFKDASGKTVRAIHYVADFQYFEDATGKAVVEDVKGMETAVFQLKRKMFLFTYPKLELRIVK